jgi:hypothetical protein
MAPARQAGQVRERRRQGRAPARRGTGGSGHGKCRPKAGQRQGTGSAPAGLNKAPAVQEGQRQTRAGRAGNW